MLEREQIEVPCPGGGRPIRTTYGEIARKSSLRSIKGLPIDTDIELAIYDITGRKVSVLVNEYQIKGYRSFKWNGKDSNGKKLGSGLYFYQLQAKNFIKTKKMIMLK